MAALKKSIRIAVREFSEPFLRTGSIDARDQFTMVDIVRGAELHRMIQKARTEEDDTFQKEVAVNHSFTHKDWTIELVGRIDGVSGAEDQTVVEEIKTTYAVGRLLKKLNSDPSHPYVLQAKLYAYMLFLQKPEQQAPRVRLHVVSAHTAKMESIDYDFDPLVFAEWFETRCDEIIKAEKTRQKRTKEWQAIGEALEFPFETPRPEQMPLIDAVQANVTKGQKMLIQAPTGLGKSIGVLYPAMKEALSRGAKVIYATPKNSQHAIAEHALAQWHEKGTKLRSVTVTAKQKICMKDEPNCNPDYCEFAKNHYDKVNEHKLIENLRSEPRLTGDVFKEYAEKYQVCPYELSFQAMPEANLIVADYNYVFSPGASIEERCQLPLASSVPTNLVIDEAHNLYTRAMEYFSPSLSLRFLEELRPRLPLFSDDAADILESCVALVASYRPGTKKDTVIVKIQKKAFETLAKKLVTYMTENAESLQDGTGEPSPMVQLYWAWGSFVEVLNLADDAFFCSYRQDDGGEFLQIHCCDASSMLAARYDVFRSVTAFSATLKPFAFYARVLGFDLENDRMAEFRSPFPTANRKLLVIPQVSTAYRDRASNCDKIASAINRIIPLKKGNYFVFFPSFEFLRQVAPLIDLPGFELVTQTSGMANRDSKAILEKFGDPDRCMVVLGVQGGVFAEGIDLPGDQLIGSIIVGPAIPPFNIEREKLREYYAQRYGADGFDYAYTFPAMSRVIQAAGRVIRTETDRGLIVLLDRRFTHDSYVQAMPEGWFESSVHELVSTTILDDIRTFWQENSQG